MDTAFRVSPDKLIAPVACVLAAHVGLVEGHAEIAAQFVAKARSGGPVPAWLGQGLDMTESRELAATGDTGAALAAAKRADCNRSPEAAITLAHVWAVAGDGDNARLALAPVLAVQGAMAERVRLQACLADARLSYHSGDRARGRRSLGRALRMAKREQLRLPFAMERSWLGPVLQRDPELADAYQHLATLAMPCAQIPARPGGVVPATR